MHPPATPDQHAGIYNWGRGDKSPANTSLEQPGCIYFPDGQRFQQNYYRFGEVSYGSSFLRWALLHDCCCDVQIAPTVSGRNLNKDRTGSCGDPIPKAPSERDSACRPRYALWGTLLWTDYALAQISVIVGILLMVFPRLNAGRRQKLKLTRKIW